ncbi:hypothetical protein EV130_110115 [Rhizobium azibense]|uniref:Uncharacterized protein n=2 Tax=Rhizobium azibense TaxID=1136135 RepID=A0A4R3QJF4_9HYPH|nr:hypothetical protein EV130_110115 [Rhizobium azibense]
MGARRQARGLSRRSGCWNTGTLERWTMSPPRGRTKDRIYGNAQSKADGNARYNVKQHKPHGTYNGSVPATYQPAQYD